MNRDKQANSTIFNSLFSSEDLVVCFFHHLSVQDFRAIKVSCHKYFDLFHKWLPTQFPCRLEFRWKEYENPASCFYDEEDDMKYLQESLEDFIDRKARKNLIQDFVDILIHDRGIRGPLRVDGAPLIHETAIPIRKQLAEYILATPKMASLVSAIPSLTTYIPYHDHQGQRDDLRLLFNKSYPENDQELLVPENLPLEMESSADGFTFSESEDGKRKLEVNPDEVSWFEFTADSPIFREFMRFTHQNYSTKIHMIDYESGPLEFMAKNAAKSNCSEILQWLADITNPDVIVARVMFHSEFPFFGKMNVRVLLRHPFGDIISQPHQIDVAFPTITEGYDPNYCMTGDCLIWMADGSKIPANSISVGDEVITLIDGLPSLTSVMAISIQEVKGSIDMVQFDGGLCLTNGHPVFTCVNGEWKWSRPEELAKSYTSNCISLIYNFVVASRSSIIVNDMIVSTLGQFCEGIDGADSFFGSERVVNRMRSNPSWPIVVF